MRVCHRDCRGEEMNEFTTEHAALVAMASTALLAQEPVRMTFPDDWTRPRNFPLPIKKTDGPVREYRPIAILEWVNDELSGANASAEARKRIAEKKAVAQE